MPTPVNPAIKSQDFYAALRSTAQGRDIVANMGIPQRVFPAVQDIPGWTDTAAVFPYKDNSLLLADVSIPTTILVLGKDKKIKYQTNSFILQTISKPLQEKFQIIETFGESSVYFYGQRTPVYTIQGTLMDADDLETLGTTTGKTKSKYMWATAFQDFYTQHLRGTKLKENGDIAAIYINNWYIKGYPVQFVLTKDSAAGGTNASFQMTWVITEDTLLKASNANFLYTKPNITPELATAINSYLTALQAYQVAYTNWAKASESTPTRDALTAKKNATEKAVDDAIQEVRRKVQQLPSQTSGSILGTIRGISSAPAN